MSGYSGAIYTVSGPLPQGSVVAISPTVGTAPGTLGAVIALDTSSSSCHVLTNGAGGITAGAVRVNGSSSSALCLQGSSAITAGTVGVQGGVLSQGGAVVHGLLTTSAPPTADPYAGLAPPVPSSVTCPGSACPNGSSLNGNGTYTLSPGTYNQAVSINGNVTVCLLPGVYYLTAAWSMNGNSTLGLCGGAAPGSGVLLYFHGGSLQMNGAAKLTALSAAASGPYAGLLYWQAGSSAVALNGAVTFGFGGWYEPTGQLTLNGGSSLTASSVVVKDFTANGAASVLAY